MAAHLTIGPFPEAASPGHYPGFGSGQPSTAYRKMAGRRSAHRTMQKARARTVANSQRSVVSADA